MSDETQPPFKPFLSLPGLTFLIAMVTYVIGTGILMLVPFPGLQGWNLLGAFVIHYAVTGTVVWLSTIATILMARWRRSYLWLLCGQIPACVWFCGIWALAFNQL